MKRMLNTAAMIAVLLITGCMTMPFDEWTKEDFDLLTDDNRVFPLARVQFVYTGQSVNVFDDIELLRSIPVSRVKRLLEEKYGIAVDTRAFDDAMREPAKGFLRREFPLPVFDGVRIAAVWQVTEVQDRSRGVGIVFNFIRFSGGLGHPDWRVTASASLSAKDGERFIVRAKDTVVKDFKPLAVFGYEDARKFASGLWEAPDAPGEADPGNSNGAAIDAH